MEKLIALLSLFRKGEAVANPELWKNGQIGVSAIAGVLGAALVVAKLYGFEIPLTAEQLNTIGGAVLAIVGLFNGAATVVSSTKVGLPSKLDPFDAAQAMLRGK